MIGGFLDRFEPFHLGIQNNRWLFWHCLGGAIAGKLFVMLGASASLAVGWVLLLAAAFEFIQYVYQLNRGGILEHNASWANWFWDSVFDVVGATLFAVLSV